MMSRELSEQRAKSYWLFSFGDVITLLITFFILMIVLNKTEITQIQKWTEAELDKTYYHLTQKVVDFEFLDVKRDSLGIWLKISSDEAFKKGGYHPSDHLNHTLEQLAVFLGDLEIFKIDTSFLPPRLHKHAQQESLRWRVELSMAGHTDNVPVATFSRLKNNWLLSTMRAQSVMNILYEHSGLEKYIFAVAGYGEHRPIADNETPEGKSLNRRVEVRITASFERNIKEQ